MKSNQQRGRAEVMTTPQRALAAYTGLTGLLALAGCAKIVGITDTEVAVLPASAAGAGGGSAPGGAGGSAGGSAGGTGGNAGSGAGGGVTGGAGGTPSTGAGGVGGSELAEMPDAAVESICEDGASRCGLNARESCSGGLWQSSPCPPNQPLCVAGACVLRGPAMVEVPLVAGSFYIDGTEVTVAQYREFLTAKAGDTSGQLGVCSWNTFYFEEAAFNPDNWPMTDVDWCDGAAYCSWAGKRLCGAVGGGAITELQLADPSVSQWALACGGPSGSARPNDAPVCNANDGFEDLGPAGSFPGCEGFYPGLFDMVGNVAEWVDSCNANTGPLDICFALGGNIYSEVPGSCHDVAGDTAGTEVYFRNTKNSSFGFRCCSG